MSSFVFVILHYKAAEATIKCIESILNLNNAENINIVVVDNGSCDGTGEKIKKIYDNKNNVDFIFLEKGFGFSEGNNKGYEYAVKKYCSDFIVMTNNDIVFEQKDFISKIENIYSNNKFDVLGPDIVNLDGSHGNPYAENPKNIKETKKYIRRARIKKNFLLFYVLYNKIKGKKNKCIHNFEAQKEEKNICLWGACLIFSKKFIQENEKVFWPETKFYFEEDILCNRVIKNKGITLYSPEIKVIHGHSESTNAAFKNHLKKASFCFSNDIKSGKIYLDILKKEHKSAVRFTTIFPYLENVNLIKDVGMIPYGMYHYYGYESSILLTGDRKQFVYLDNEVKGLKGIESLSFIKSPMKKTILWLLFNAGKIDVLHLFHQTMHTRISIFIYKMLNPKGLVYVHLDSIGTEYESYKVKNKKGKVKNAFYRFFINKFVYSNKNSNDIFWGVQNKEALVNIKGIKPYYNIEYMPNGYLDICTDKEIDFSAKKNIVLTVGRIGEKVKRTDVLMEGFRCSGIYKKGWKLRIVGPIKYEFKEYINEFFENYPELKPYIDFTGAIYDRKKLYEEYAKAKIFCLTSEYESFGIASVEALSKGCTLILSRYKAAKEITDNERLGRLFDTGNYKDLGNLLESITDDSEYLESNFYDAVETAATVYEYGAILKPLDKWINDKRNF